MTKSPELPSITIIGGGTGTATLLRELKHHTPNLSAVVNMSDDGGSSGLLRKQYGVLPPGDVRQCITALSNNAPLAHFMNSRLPDGHTPGNLLLAGIEERYGSFTAGVELMSQALGITGTVHPVSIEPHDLIMEDGDEVIRGEYKIAHRQNNSDHPTVQLDPPAQINPAARSAIKKADLIAFAPGNLYGSVLPALAVSGMRAALQASKAPAVLVTNLTNQPGQTDGWHVADYVEALERYVGAQRISHAIYNTDRQQPDFVSTEATRLQLMTARTIGARLVAECVEQPQSHDQLVSKPRNTLRHDAAEVSGLIMDLALTGKAL